MFAESRREDVPAQPEALEDAVPLVLPGEARIAGNGDDRAAEDRAADDAEADDAEAGGDEGAAALRDLIAAGLVSHEAIGDPDRLPGGEAAALGALCRRVAGPVYRVGPFHYAFAAGPDGAEALATAVAELGPDALWIGALAVLDRPDTAPDAPPPPEAALLLLRAREAATAASLAAAGPELLAAIDARYAASCARLAAAGLPDGADLAGIEARLTAVEARLAEVADGLAAARLGALVGFEERLGLALAEFLARIERHEAE